MSIEQYEKNLQTRAIRRMKSSKEKTPWAIAIAQLNHVFGVQTFAHPILDYSECKNLSIVINNEEGTFTETEIKEARSIFITSNLKLVRQISLGYLRRYSRTPIEDLFQMGVIGLIRAVEKWDPGREFLFSTYATWWIRQSITRCAIDEESLIRIPVHMQEKVNRVLEYEEQYLEFFNSLPDEQEAADSMNIDLSEYLSIKSAIFSFERIQDISRRDGELRCFAMRPNGYDESVTDPFFQVERTVFIEQLLAVLGGLTYREEQIIKQRFGLIDGTPKTLDEIGLEFDVTRERIRQIEAKTMEKLRHPSRTSALKDFLESEDLSQEIYSAIEIPSGFRVGGEPLC
jgi:RNA polymerase primary sigma factor